MTGFEVHLQHLHLTCNGRGVLETIYHTLQSKTCRRKNIHAKK